MLIYQPKIVFRDMRTSGVRDVLIYCRDHRCSHLHRERPKFSQAEWGPVETCAQVHQICPRQRFAAIRQ